MRSEGRKGREKTSLFSLFPSSLLPSILTVSILSISLLTIYIVSLSSLSLALTFHSVSPFPLPLFSPLTVFPSSLCLSPCLSLHFSPLFSVRREVETDRRKGETVRREGKGETQRNEK
jgi:hypothetical protein